VDALAHLRQAYDLAPEKVREWAKEDPDLDSIRADAPFLAESA
jgi:hypothetical protein